MYKRQVGCVWVLLTKGDPYVLIDLDVPLRKNVKGVDGETIQRCKIAHDLGTYTEVSPGGGWHCYVEMTEPFGTGGVVDDTQSGAFSLCAKPGTTAPSSSLLIFLTTDIRLALSLLPFLAAMVTMLPDTVVKRLA